MLSTKEIYNLLLAGKKLTMEFNSAQEAENFRVSMFRYKRLQDRILVGLGVSSEEEKQAFVFKYDNDSREATLQFKDKPRNRTYEIKIIEDSEE